MIIVTVIKINCAEEYNGKINIMGDERVLHPFNHVS